MGATPNPSTTSTTLGCLPTSNPTCPSLESTIRSTANDCPSRPTQDSKVVGVGVGLGASLGIMLLVFVALFVVEKRRNQKLLQEKRQTTTENGNYMGQSWINQQGPAPQNLAQHEMPPGPFLLSWMVRRHESRWSSSVRLCHLLKSSGLRTWGGNISETVDWRDFLVLMGVVQTKNPQWRSSCFF